MGPTKWFINGDRVYLTAADRSGNPYYRNNIPSPLIIPSFTATLVGTYGCEGYLARSRVTIDLAISGMCNFNNKYNCDTILYH